MKNIKVKVDNVVKGKYDCDCLFTTIDSKPIQICFNKKDNISKYVGQEINLAMNNGIYIIQVDTSK